MHETATVTKIEVVRTGAMRLTDTFIVNSREPHDAGGDEPRVVTEVSACQSITKDAGELVQACPAPAGINSP
jgi:hypothetical protein